MNNMRGQGSHTRGRRSVDFISPEP